MKITALLVLKCTPEGSDPVILVNASDLSSFGFFQRPSVREFIVFVGRTVAKRTPPGQRQSVQHEGLILCNYLSFPVLSAIRFTFYLVCLAIMRNLLISGRFVLSFDLYYWGFWFIIYWLIFVL